MKQGRGAVTVLINYLDVAEKKKGEVKLLSFVSISFDGGAALSKINLKQKKKKKSIFFVQFFFFLLFFFSRTSGE